MPLKFGKRHAVVTPRAMRSAHAMAFHLDKLGPPPPSSAPYYQTVEKAVGGAGKWGMLGNDIAGDCTMADGCHGIMLRTANVGQIVVPTTQDAFAAYTALTGYDPSQTDAQGNNPTDQGANELDVCRFMQTTGILGHKSVNYATIHKWNLAHIKWAIQLFSNVRTGIAVPDDMERQFDAGGPFRRTANSRLTDDGHDIPAIHFDGDKFWVVTWGARIETDWDWLSWCMDEVHAECYPDFIRAQGTSPGGFSLQQLVNDLANVE